VDEIKQYVDGRYISPHEACWRTFAFPINGRNLAIERLFFHLLGEHQIYFRDADIINQPIVKPSITESMFTSLMECNKKFPKARQLTYNLFVSKFVYVKKDRCWKPRKKRKHYWKTFWISPTTREILYLRIMLIVVKRPLCYADIKIV